MTTKLFKIAYTVIIILFVISFFQTKKLPPISSANKNLINEPIQTETTRDDFSFSYKDKDYQVKPMADYELWGQVVTVNNINAWYNYYHDENSVNLKDVCVVWGSNIENGVYLDKEIKFKSGEWTCYYQWTSKLEKKFYPNKLSNNHLLTANEEIQKIIRNVHVGDQIHLKGMLVDYSEIGTDWYRKTSLSRDDINRTSRSGGACEVFYVDEIELLYQNQALWNKINHLAIKLLFILVIVQFLLFFVTITLGLIKKNNKMNSPDTLIQ